MYKVVFNSSDFSDYFHNDNLLFSVKRKRLLLGIRSVNNIFSNNKLIFSFYNSEFTFLYWKVRILEQNLDKILKLEKVKKKYILKVDNKEISLKFTNNPFKKIIATVYVDNNIVGEIQRGSKNSKDYYTFSFNKNSTLEYYILVLFSIYSVGITDNA